MTTDKPTFLLNFRQLAILKYLLYRCPDGKFQGLNQLAIDLDVSYRTILIEVNVLANQNFIDIEYKKAKRGKGIAKTFLVPSKNKLMGLLRPLMLAAEDALIDIANLTNNYRAIENVKLDKRWK